MTQKDPCDINKAKPYDRIRPCFRIRLGGVAFSHDPNKDRREHPPKCIEVWKHGVLINGKQDSKYEPWYKVLFPSVIIKSRL